MMSAWKVAFDALTGNAPVPSDETFAKNDLGHGWLQDLIDRALGRNGSSAPNGVPRRGPAFGPQNAPGNIQTFDTTMTPESRGLLDAIGVGEARSYRSLYGDSPSTPNQFTDMSHFPDFAGSATSAGPTHAAGRYQFEPGTYDRAAAALGLKDFSPASQDKAALWLAQSDYKSRTGRDLMADIHSTNPAVRAGVAAGLHDTWPSINADTFLRRVDRYTDVERANVPVAPPAPTAAPPCRLPLMHPWRNLVGKAKTRDHPARVGSTSRSTAAAKRQPTCRNKATTSSLFRCRPRCP